VVSVRVELALDHGLVECGGQVLGGVSWTGNLRLDRVGVVLRYRTEGRGDVDSAAIAHCDLGPAESGQARFRLDVPPLGPVTYHGQLLRLLWQVAVAVPVTKASGRARSGLAVADLTVAPQGWLQRPGA
jgi:hypothetical protein